MITVKNLHKQFDSIHALNGIDEVIEKRRKKLPSSAPRAAAKARFALPEFIGSPLGR